MRWPDAPAYVFRLRPTARQHLALAACVDGHRELYNAALLERRDAWAHSKTRINYGDQPAQLSEIRSLRPDLAPTEGINAVARQAQRGVRHRSGFVGPRRRHVHGSMHMRAADRNAPKHLRRRQGIDDSSVRSAISASMRR
jgi:hypothetical protein